MIAARQIFLGRGAGAQLPYDAEVEYLESTGTQKIDTGLTFNLPCVFDFSYYGLPSTYYIFGYNIPWEIIIRVYVTWYFLERFNGWTFPRGQLADVRGVLTSSGGTLELNGSVVATTSRTPNAGAQMLLFALPTSTGTDYCTMRLYRFAASSGEKSVDLIPVRKDGVGYMYDRVSGALFGNDGTGDFVIGPDKS